MDAGFIVGAMLCFSEKTARPSRGLLANWQYLPVLWVVPALDYSASADKCKRVNAL